MTTRPPPPCALILAAVPGGREAALTRVGTRSLVEAHVQSFRRAGVADIAIVWGAAAEELPKGCGDVRVVLEPEPKATMFDALVLGLFALDRAPVLVLPVANDLLDDDTLEMLVDEARDFPQASAIVPRFGDQHGHPVALLRTGVDWVVRDALAENGVHRLDRLLGKWPGVRPLDVSDAGIARVFETPRVARRL